MKENIKIPAVLKEQARKLKEYYSVHYPALAPLAEQCFLNTVETTIKQTECGDYFVITGDIPAMWLRDAAAQVRLYVRYAAEDEDLQTMLESVIAMQAKLVCVDPYANAFNESANGHTAGYEDDTEINPHVWERKYEVDSLCAPLYLAHNYWKTTGITRIFNEQFKQMIKEILHVFTVEQDHTQSPYYFQRYHCVKTDTLPAKGKGRPINVTGMTWSGFRPSDDCCKFGYLIPSNMMAVVALGYAEEICRCCYDDKVLAEQCAKLAEEIRDGIQDYGIVDHPVYGKMYAYETDGFGNYNLMDDANSPSLLAMPYLGYCEKEDPIYQSTRKFVLSEDNPCFYQGTWASGVGSPHTPAGYVWHIGIVMQALTSSDREEIMLCLERLACTHAGTNFMHESFDPYKPENFTRPWFAWANTLFAEFLAILMEKKFWE